MLDTVIRGGRIVDGTGSAPYTADLGIRGGAIVEIGTLTSRAKAVVDADGATVTPGWIDAHTHYDGQVTWDDRLEDSATNGVTTVITGNCGVGFAPVRPDGADDLVDLMEGVEDIPGTALHEGVAWGNWETFPEYVAYLDGLRWAVDVGVQLPHGPLRLYVMGARSHDPDESKRRATGDDLREMARQARLAAEAGALGFSTSRVLFHRSKSGYVLPGTYAPDEELYAILRGLREGGGGVLQSVPPSGASGEDDPHDLFGEVALYGRASREVGVNVAFTLLQSRLYPDRWREGLERAVKAKEGGARLYPMVSPRCQTILTSLQTHHPFVPRPTFKRLRHLPREALVRELRRPEIKTSILSEPDEPKKESGAMEDLLPPLFQTSMDRTFPMGPVVDYEPRLEDSFAARAAAAGRDPLEFFYDFLLEDDGRAVGMYLIANYAYGDLDVVEQMLASPHTVSGLSDAGAHVTMICDAANGTFHVTHWARDRSRGGTLPLELLVSKLTSVPARIWGLGDRGAVEVGKRADLNVFDYDRLEAARPSLRHDLPAGGSRFVAPASGYLATFVNGVRTIDDDRDTGARPGRVARSGAGPLRRARA